MRVVFFVHSLLSDWNHGNAHFLRGVATELLSRGHDLRIYEPAAAWSVQNLVADHGEEALEGTRRAYPALESTRYSPESLDLDQALDGADLVLVHEWNSHDLVRRIGLHRRRERFVLLFHDTHHRSISDPEAMAAYDLSEYDGVLAFGEVIRERYLKHGWAARAWTWHEAADVRVFKPESLRIEGLTPNVAKSDIVWIGNWGDDERTAELREFLIEPVRRTAASATVYGVRYPEQALDALKDAGLTYRGWIPNYGVPEVFARHRMTVHVPRRPYVKALRGIPTIRPFEALACGIPLISAPWDDAETLFRPGIDYLVARTGADMERHIRDLRHDPALASDLAAHGLETIRARHTCAHRVDELSAIAESLSSRRTGPSARAASVAVAARPACEKAMTT
jgi:spore maturation protein CgeB